MTEKTPPPYTATDAGDEAAEAADQALALAPAMGALANTESARAIAHVQARALLARKFPRDEMVAQDKIIAECERLSLAQKATYVYTRGGEEISGPTIRLAEVVVQQWGNMTMGVREVSRDMANGVSVCVAFAEDLQTGLSDEREFHVRHWREVRNGKGYAVKSDRDIRELVANYGARSKRAAIQAVVPDRVFEAAVEACEETLLDNVRTDDAAIADMLQAFAEVGVQREHVEARVRCPLEDITQPQMVSLHKIYNSIKGGDGMPSDWFDIPAPVEDKPAGNSVSDMVRRAKSAASAKKSHALRTKTEAAQVVERMLLDASTKHELNTASVRIGPVADMDDKGALYEIWEARKDQLDT